jgi:Xylose isomerase-like TIM barrel
LEFIMITRRDFLAGSVATIAAASCGVIAGEQSASPELKGEVGVTMSSFARLETDAGPEKISILDWPRIFRDELDMRVIDLNSGVLTSTEPDYLDRVRAAADKAGCFLTNVKINRSDIDLGNSDLGVREKALVECQRWIDVAARLGLRWARPLPLKERPDMAHYLADYRQLASYAADRKVQMLVENYGWLGDNAEAATQLIAAVGKNIAACPDTGNWVDKETRYAGLEKMFPLAATCDFKAGKLSEGGEHPAWDLKKCFTIAWDAGFRGPWCLEHANTDRKTLFRELGLLRDMLRKWMAERA